MEIISAELDKRGIVLPKENEAVIKRVIHTTADFDYAENLFFSPNVVSSAVELLRNKKPIVITDTHMALSGISKPSCAKLGIETYCFMSDDDVSALSKKTGMTRASCSIDKAARLDEHRPIIFAIGNAPTALVRIRQLLDANLVHPEVIIAVPVGFVNVVNAKELIMETNVPQIVAKGQKGGSTIAAAIMNALLYEATGAR